MAQAQYKYSQYLQQNNHKAFDTLWEPGASTQYSGIYRCEACGKCDTSVTGYPLPPQNHAQHNPAQGRILRRLIVAAE